MKLLFPTLCLALAANFLSPTSSVQAQSGIPLKTFNLKAGKLLLDPTRPRLYATLPADNSIAVIDTGTNTVTTTFFIGSNPVDLAISQDGTRLYVANKGSTSAAIGVVNLETLTTLTSLPAPFAPSAVAAGLDNRLYVLSSTFSTNGIAQIDATTGVSQATFGPRPRTRGASSRSSPDRGTLFGDSGSSPSRWHRLMSPPPRPVPRTKPILTAPASNGECLTISHNGQFFVFPNGGGTAAATRPR